MTPTTPPLAGVRVLDLSRVLAGPVCTQVLADLGADVIKVERPVAGDDTRQWGPPFLPGGGPSAYYLSCNRSKRSIAVDLSNEAGREVVEGLARKADVLVENFLRDALERFSLTHERLRALNPELVFASISAFGRTGPLADAPGYDLMIQAAAGLMSITGEPEGTPMKVGVAISDVLTGLYAAISVLAGLVARGKGGGGRGFDLALADCTLASLVNVVQSTLVTGKRPVRYGNAHPQIVPYESFATQDGHLVLAIGADRQWQRLCRALERDDLAGDERFATNPLRVAHRRELVPLLAAEFVRRTTAEWQALLSAAEAPHSPVRSVDEAVVTAQTTARQMVREVVDGAGRRYRVVASPIHTFDEPPADRSAQDGAGAPLRPPPELGEHTDEVLAEWLGYDAQQIAQLRSTGAVA